MSAAPVAADKVEAAAPAETETADSPLMELYGKVCEDVRSRSTWLTRQTVWYAMRHDGLRRRNKPWPTAADLHYPLADSIIEKLKPFYFNQLFGQETVAQFIAKDPELVPFAEDLGYWFDWKLKQASNLEEEILIAIDKKLMAGHVPVKVYWDADRKRLAFDAIEPQHCIVPDWTKGLEEADRVTIVHHLSPEQYKRDGRFTKKEPDFIRSITGRGSAEAGESEELANTREIREGITHTGAGQNLIIVWEIWEQLGDGWHVSWISPLVPAEALRPTQKNPFTHGELPVVRFDVEIKDKGHYASRGIPERAGAFEQSLCKQWNEKNDFMTLCNRPIFTSTAPIPNAGNLTLRPGQIVPGGLQAVTMPQPPVSFDQEMQSTREIAEYNIGMPDYGVGQQNTQNGPRTATEVNQVGSLMGVTVDLKARTFRMREAKLLRLAWATLVQYDRDTQFFVEGECKRLNEQALKTEAWMVMPNGSSESWNRQAQMQKAVMRKQLLAQSPWIDQEELDRTIVELDDPRLVKRLFIDRKKPQADAYNDEAAKIPALNLGMPLPAQPSENEQPVRIKALMDFMEQRGQLGHPVLPEAVHAIKQRIGGHLQNLAQTGPKGASQARQIAKGIDKLSQAHAKAAATAGPPSVPQAGGQVPPGAPQGAPGQAPPTMREQLGISVKWGDLERSEQEQILNEIGITPATIGETAANRALTHAEENPEPVAA